MYRVSLDDFSVDQTTLVGGPYNCISFMSSPDALVASCDDSPPVLIDLKRNAVIWAGKNANDTSIGLNSKFETSAIISLSTSVFVAGDLKGKLRFYDVSSDRRKPYYELPVFEMFTLTNNYSGTSGMGIVRPITRLSHNGKTLFLGDTFGTVIGLDVCKSISHLSICPFKIGQKAHVDFCKKMFPMVSSFRGIMGSVRDIKFTDTHAFVVSAGRFAYWFDLSSKRKYDKVFLKQKLTCCLPIVIAGEQTGVHSDEQTGVPTEEHTQVETFTDTYEPTIAEISLEQQPTVVSKLESLESSDLPMSKSKRRRMKKGCSKD